MPKPTLKQARDWTRRLRELTGEMEEVYGDPGPNYPPAVNMATFLAFRAAAEEQDDTERRELGMVGDAL